MFDWIEKNPITEKGTDATRTIDTGIRCMNWCYLILPMYATGKIDDNEVVRLLEVINQQFLNLRKRYIGKYSLSNWGVLQTTAMCVAYTWYEEFLSKEIGEWAWKELANQLELQILEDGAHWEQSAMYHVEVLNCISKVLQQIYAAKEVGVELSDDAIFAVTECKEWTTDSEALAGPGIGYEGYTNAWLVNAVRVLSRHVLYTVDPEGNQLAQCDSDVTNIKDVMVRSSLLLNGGEVYRYMAGSHMDMDSAWMFGADGSKSVAPEEDAVICECRMLYGNPFRPDAQIINASDDNVEYLCCPSSRRCKNQADWHEHHARRAQKRSND